MNYLIWEHREKKIYEFESDCGEIRDVAMSAVKRLLEDCFQNTEIEISISADNGITWSRFEYELCMNPSVYETKYVPESNDPRPKPKKL